MQKKQGVSPLKIRSRHRPEYPLPLGREYFDIKTIRPVKPSATVPENWAADALTRRKTPPQTLMPSPAPSSKTQETTAGGHVHITERGKSSSHTGQPGLAHVTSATTEKPHAPMSRMAIKAVNADTYAEKTDDTRQPLAGLTHSRMAIKAVNADIFAEPDTSTLAEDINRAHQSSPKPSRLVQDQTVADGVSMDARTEPRLAVPRHTVIIPADTADAHAAAAHGNSAKPRSTRPHRSRMPVAADSYADVIDALPYAVSAAPNKNRKKAAPGRAAGFPSVRPPKPETRKKRRILVLAGLGLVVTIAALFLLLQKDD